MKRAFRGLTLLLRENQPQKAHTSQNYLQSARLLSSKAALEDEVRAIVKISLFSKTSTQKRYQIFSMKNMSTTFVKKMHLLQYFGRWYEYSKYFAIFELFGTCTNAVYSNQTPPSSNNLVIGVHNMGTNRL